MLSKREPNRNFGARSTLPLNRDSPAALGFRYPKRACDDFVRAKLIIHHSGFGLDRNLVTVEGLKTFFIEGNGDFEVGKGEGATWECSVDRRIQFNNINCDADRQWEGGEKEKVNLPIQQTLDRRTTEIDISDILNRRCVRNFLLTPSARLTLLTKELIREDIPAGAQIVFTYRK